MNLPVSFVITIDATGKVSGQVPVGTVVVPPVTPPVTPPPVVIPPVTPPPSTDPIERHKANVQALFAQGDRGRVLSNFYFEYVPAYKSILQDWVANVLLPGSGLDYNHWADPRTFAQEFAYPVTDAEWAKLLVMIRGY